MYAPSSSYNKENPNPPKVTFRVVRGRVIPIVQGKQPKGATRILRDELQNREQEIKYAQAGKRGVGYDDSGNAVRNFGTKSTFPEYYSRLGFKNKGHFMEVLNKKRGPKFDALVDDSIKGLLSGRNSSYGELPPNEKFRLATKQEFNNRGVSFRMKDGKVRPMRFGGY